MIRPLCLGALVIAAAGLVQNNFTNRGAAQQTRSRLPGAMKEIDAAQFASLQLAFDALPDEGGVVRLPPGQFDISEPLVLTCMQDVLIEGAGTATHIHNRNTAGKPALVLRPKEPADDGDDNRQWRIHLSNFRVTGTERSGHGIVARRVNELYVEGVSVSNHGGDGIRLDHCYEDPRICDSLITYNQKTGLNLIGCHDIVVSANQFEENHDALRCIDGYNLCMTGNNLDDHLSHGVIIENTYGSVVSGNMIEECAGPAIVLDRDCYGNTLSANVIAHNGAGIDLRDAHGCAVSANTFTIMKTDALRIAGGSSRITVTGNNFSDSYIGDDSIKRSKNDEAAAGLTLDDATDVAISGNLFAGVRPKALKLDGEAKRVLFANNVLTDVDSDHGRLEESVLDNIVR